MPLITFLSDFGWRDHYVAAVKAKILSENDSAQIIDITHNINTSDIIHASHVLKAVYKDFPEFSVHLCGVNNQSEGREKLLLAELNNHYFLGSNNGLFSLLEEKVPSALYTIPVGEELSTFPERDFLASTATKLLNQKPADFLEPFPDDQFKSFISQKVKATRELIQGHVMHVDGYGNLITNINKTDFDILSKNKDYQITFRNYAVIAVQQHFNEVQGGEVFVLFNSQNLMMIGIKDGNAAQLLGLEYGSMVRVRFSP